MAGSSLSDNEVFSEKLSLLLGVPVYNYAPSDPITFLRDPRFQARKPRIVIWESVGRLMIDSSYQYYLLPVANLLSQENQWAQSAPAAEATRLSNLIARRAYHETMWRLWKSYPDDVLIHQPSGMLFHKDTINVLSQLKSDPKTVSDAIYQVSNLYNQLGIKLIIMQVPEKEGIYTQRIKETELVSSEVVEAMISSERYFEQVSNLLKQNNVPVINLYRTFYEATKEGHQLYFKDDTHWNSEGSALAAVKAAEAVHNYLSSKP